MAVKRSITAKPSAFSRLAPVGIHLAGKAFVNLGCGGAACNGFEHLDDALKESKGKARERGVLTISNHISVMDDPLLWSIMPWAYFLNHRKTRWVSGAQDIMFTNPTYANFFHAGQVIETDRWGGIFQPAITDSAARLTQGDWVHVFPEGRVSQASLNPTYDVDHMFRFRWGVSRMFLAATTMPKVIPMHISGFDKVMPEPRGFPAFLPRPVPKGTLEVNIGEPLDAVLKPIWDEWRAAVAKGILSDDASGEGEKDIRIEVASLLRREVKKLVPEAERAQERSAKP